MPDPGLHGAGGLGEEFVSLNVEGDVGSRVVMRRRYEYPRPEVIGRKRNFDKGVLIGDNCGSGISRE